MKASRKTKRAGPAITAIAGMFIGSLPAAFAAETPLVTGNGQGFAVFSIGSGDLSRFYAHPYKFEKPDPKNPLSEGIETANYLKSLSWDPCESSPAKPAAGAEIELNGKNALIRFDHSANSPIKKADALHVDYVKQSHIILAQDETKAQYFFMPWALKRNVLVTACQHTAISTGRPSLNVEWAHTLKAQSTVTIENTEVQKLSFAGVNGVLAIVPLEGKPEEIRSKKQKNVPFPAVAMVSLTDPAQLPDAVREIKNWEGRLPVQKLIDRELKQVEAWRSKPSVRFKSEQERKLWRQSEMVLRLGQILEANNNERHSHGLIVASLPDGAWFVPWVRDMAYATIALTRMGHKDEAAWAIQSYFDARPVGKMQKEVGNVPYQVSVVRYFGDGAEEPFFTMEGADNIELDNWGLVLWALGEYMDKYHDDEMLEYKTYRGTIYESARDFVVQPLIKNLEPYKDGLIVKADTSIWEERQKDKKHFAYSTIAAIQGLSCFDRIAARRGDIKTHEELQEKIALLQKGFRQAFINSGKLRGTLEPGIKNQVDGAALSAITLGIVTDPYTIKDSAAEMSRLKMPSGGYRRVTSTVKDPEIFEYWYERQEFLFVNFLMAEVYLKLGLPEKAAELIKPMVDKAAQDHYFIPEMYVSEVNNRFTGPVGTPTGAIPMVGYGAGIYGMYMLERGKGRK